METAIHNEVSSVSPIAPSSQPLKGRSRPRWLRWTIVAALIVSLAVLAGVERKRHQNAITYETVAVERGSIQAKVTATGNLNPVVDVLVSSQVSGNIKALYADWNSRVRKGQLVALIDFQIFQTQVDQAKAIFQSAHSAALTAEAQLAKTKSDLSSAIANEKNAEAISAKDLANEKKLQLQWQRAQNLRAAQVISQQDYDTAKANYDAATAQLTADQALIDAARQNNFGRSIGPSGDESIGCNASTGASGWGRAESGGGQSRPHPDSGSSRRYGGGS
jgi:HlyD family secretion protein